MSITTGASAAFQIHRIESRLRIQTVGKKLTVNVKYHGGAQVEYASYSNARDLEIQYRIHAATFTNSRFSRCGAA